MKLHTDPRLAAITQNGTLVSRMIVMPYEHDGLFKEQIKTYD